MCQAKTLRFIYRNMQDKSVGQLGSLAVKQKDFLYSCFSNLTGDTCSQRIVLVTIYHLFATEGMQGEACCILYYWYIAKLLLFDCNRSRPVLGTNAKTIYDTIASFAALYSNDWSLRKLSLGKKTSKGSSTNIEYFSSGELEPQTRRIDSSTQTSTKSLLIMDLSQTTKNYLGDILTYCQITMDKMEHVFILPKVITFLP